MKAWVENEDQLAGHLHRVLRRALESGRAFSWALAADLALVQLSRPGRPAAALTPALRQTLRATLGVLSRDLADPRDPRQLWAYCRRAAEAALRALPRPRHPGAALQRPGLSLRGLATAALYAEYGQARDADDLLRRAVTRALRERRRQGGQVARLAVEERDPLRALLDLPASGPVYLPRRDVRVWLASGQGRRGRQDREQVGQAAPLPGLLRQAARFAEASLRPALGDELWGLCRPVGFGDARATRVLVQVTSSALAHEVSLRKRELLARLQHVPGFEQVRDVRFLVEERRALPLRRAPPPPPEVAPRSPVHARDPGLRALLERFVARASAEGES